eukprot:TRINITY_DN149433_c0_g1_i2.p2 TRINITY_DN149433_c0_g1~~TRINITY_DN149433_c0_g1_i2.p2  ORF type:complete len:170 (+),score=7.48 TRINITY_DN149433_c0_g1_i2:920-1429(+)
MCVFLLLCRLDLDYSPTGQEIVAGSYDRTIRIFDIGQGRSRDVYHTKRMQRVLCCRFSLDSHFVISGSEDANLRVWKAQASLPLGPRSYREREANAYRDALKKKFAHLRDIRRIARHRHVPSLIKSTTLKRKVMEQSRKRKEENRRQHSTPGTVPHVSQRKKAIHKEVE